MQPGVHATAPVGVVDAGSWVEAGRRWEGRAGAGGPQYHQLSVQETKDESWVFKIQHPDFPHWC